MSTKIPLAAQSSAKSLDNELLGNWKNNKPQEAVNAIMISKGRDKNTYFIEVTKPGTDYMTDAIFFIGWITKLKNEKFLVLQELDQYDEPDDVFYLYSFEITGTNLSTNYLGYTEEEMETIKSTRDYEHFVLDHIKNNDLWIGETVWVKE